MTESARRKEGRRQTRPSLCTTMPPFAIAAGHADSDLSCSFLPGNLVSVNLTAAKEVKEETFRTELKSPTSFYSFNLFEQSGSGGSRFAE